LPLYCFVNSQNSQNSEIFDINPGDTLLTLGDEEQGIAVVKADVMKEVAVKILNGLGHFKNGIDDEK